MKKIERLKQERDALEDQLVNLREALIPFQRPINILLAGKGKILSDMSVQEIIQVANLLIEMQEEE